MNVPTQQSLMRLLGGHGFVYSYREVVRRHPARIQTIYIRDVQVPERALLVGPIIEELGREKVPMLLAADYAAAVAQAAGLGLVG